MRNIAVVTALLALAGQSAIASGTACTFEGVKESQYYELEFIGYSNVRPVIAFSATGFASGRRVTLPPESYSLKDFSQEAAMVHLEFRNPGDALLPPSFSLVGQAGKAQRHGRRRRPQLRLLSGHGLWPVYTFEAGPLRGWG